MKGKKVGFLGFLVKLIISLGLLVFISGHLEMSKSARLLTNSDIFYIFVAITISLIQAGLALFRWHTIVIKKGMHISGFQIARYFWLGLFFNQVFPSSIGGDAVRTYCLVRDEQSLGRAMLSVLLDRLLGITGLVMLTGFMVFQFGDEIISPEVRWVVTSLLTVMIGALSAIFFMDRVTPRLPDWSIVKGLTTLAVDARHLLGSQYGFTLAAISIVIHLLSIVIVGILAKGLMIEVDWIILAMIVPVAILLTAVPVSIAGWGVREGVMVFGLGLGGVLGEEALALSILYGLSIVIVSLPAVLYWVIDSDRGY